MNAARAPALVLWTGRGTLREVERNLRRARVRVERLTSVAAEPVPPSRWFGALPPPREVETVVVLSRVAVACGLLPWSRRARLPLGRVEAWVSGPATAAAVRAAGVRRVRAPRNEGAEAVRSALRSGPLRTIVYFRSDRAGPAFARALRREGHRVYDPVVYRLRDARALGGGPRAVLESADLVLVSSPSGLSSLRRGLGPGRFPRFRRRARLVVLGSRSLRSARGHGFRGVLCVRSTAAQRLTRELLRALDDARR